MLYNGHLRLAFAVGVFLVFALGFSIVWRRPTQHSSEIYPPFTDHDSAVIDTHPGQEQDLGDLLYGNKPEDASASGSAIASKSSNAPASSTVLEESSAPEYTGKYGDITDLLTEDQHEYSNNNMKIQHKEIFSNLTHDGQRFRMDWGDHHAYNPSIIPHPNKPDTYIMIAQRDKKDDESNVWSIQLYCEATFKDNKMQCKKSPLSLPVASTVSPHCTGDMDWFNSMIGPHDARLYHGFDKPYLVWGSQSNFNCLGQWMQDLRRVIDWVATDIPQNDSETFFWPTNLQRPPPYHVIEKNWFAFWDHKGEMYLHFDITPTRVFTKLNPDGSVGEDLSPLAAESDSRCMKELMPQLQTSGLEWIHQATNSLSITLCKRSDPDCKKSEDNTFLFTIFQTKTFYMHGVYEPYIMLFKQSPPFEVHGFSSKPFWYHGRGLPGGNWTLGTTKPKDQSEMIFTTSMSWKNKGSTYHGYLDDELFICFGIEDQASGGIDIFVEELMSDIAFCP